MEYTKCILFRQMYFNMQIYVNLVDKIYQAVFMSSQIF